MNRFRKCNIYTVFYCKLHSSHSFRYISLCLDVRSLLDLCQSEMKQDMTTRLRRFLSIPTPSNLHVGFIVYLVFHFCFSLLLFVQILPDSPHVPFVSFIFTNLLDEVFLKGLELQAEESWIYKKYSLYKILKACFYFIRQHFLAWY